MFAGQGSQYYRMAEHLYRSDAEFAAIVDRYDQVFQDTGMRSAVAEIYRPDRTQKDSLEDIRVSHISILVIELALCDYLKTHGIEPSAVLGSSLGEYASMIVARVVPVESIARCLATQVDLLHQSAATGKMLAVLDPIDEATITSLGVDIAAINTDRNTIVAGNVEAINELAKRLRQNGATHSLLDVNYAFHSRCMDGIQNDFHSTLRHIDTSVPQVRYFSCVSAAEEDELERTHLWDVVRKPIRFRDAMTAARKSIDDAVFVDLSPSGTLANFTNQILANEGVKAESVLNPLRSPERTFDVIENLTQMRAAKTKTTHIKGERKLNKSAVNDPALAILFPGQGSQMVGMGAEAFAAFPDMVSAASSILGYSIEELCLRDPNRKLSSTEYTQPAIYSASVLQYRLYLEKGGTPPGFLAGHSLGEYSALAAADVFDFETGLRLVKRRGELMSEAAGGFMAAVLGIPHLEVSRVLKESGLSDIDIANINADTQIVISGPEALARQVESAFTTRDIGYVRLNVSGAFHSRLMGDSATKFAEYIGNFDFNTPTIPVIANTHASPYTGTSSRQTAQTLVDQLTNPVKWVESIHYLYTNGVEKFVEVGPGEVLTKLLDKIEKPAIAPVSARSTPHTASNQPSFETCVGSRLGSRTFKDTYGAKYSYVCGAMYRGISSVDLVTTAAASGVLAFFGAGGLPNSDVEDAVRQISQTVDPSGCFGVNVVHDPSSPMVEQKLLETLLNLGVRNIEASSFLKVTPALVHYRAAGLRRDPETGKVVADNRIMAKVSRPEIAEGFFAPAPQNYLRQLVTDGLISHEQATLANEVAMIDDLTVEADSGGHTDRREALVLLPTFERLRNKVHDQHGLIWDIRIGAAGGIGTPEAAAAAFALGADYVVTGSINLCSKQSGMSPQVKDFIEAIGVQDTDYAPAGDMFELGAQIQVVKKGTLFAARARKLYDLYRRFDRLEDIDAKTVNQLEQRYFGRTLEQVWEETQDYLRRIDPSLIQKAENTPKLKMSLVFRWYFGYSQRAAMEGDEARKLDYQIHCGPALGAFNQWVAGTERSSWRKRNVDEIATAIMVGAVEHLGQLQAGLTATEEREMVAS